MFTRPYSQAAAGCLLPAALYCGLLHRDACADPALLSPFWHHAVTITVAQPFDGTSRSDSTIALRFSLPVHWGVKEQGAAPAWVRLEPQIAGEWRWTAPDCLEFFPQDGLAPNTGYVVVLNPRAAGAVVVVAIGSRGDRRDTSAGGGGSRKSLQNGQF